MVIYTVCTGVRVSSLSKGDSGRKTLDFYARSSPDDEQHKLSLSACTSTAIDDVTAVSSDNHLDKEDTHGLLTCPICNKPVFDDNNVLNSHIDVCLNQQVIDLEKTASPLIPKKHKR